VERAPGVLRVRYAIDLVVALFDVASDVAAEVVVEVFLARQERAPRRDAAGAVVDHSARERTAVVVLGLHARVARCGARDADRRLRRGARGKRAVLDDGPLALPLLDLDDRRA